MRMHHDLRQPSRSAVAAALGAILTLTAVGPVHAQEATSEPSARDLFFQGSAAYRMGNYEEAVDVWQRAYALDPRPLLLYNLGQAYERLGRLTEAVDATERYLSQADPNDPQRADAMARLSAMRERLQRTGIRVVTDVEGGVILVDGEDRGRTPRRDPIQVAPGPHTVVIQARGYQEFRSSVTVTAGMVAQVPVELRPIGGAGPEVAAAGAEPEEETEVVRPLGGWVTVGAGGALVVTGLVLDLLANSTANDATYANSPNADTARRLARTGDTLLFTGIAAAAGGVLWLLLGAKEVQPDQPAATTWRIDPVIGRGTFGADARVRF